MPGRAFAAVAAGAAAAAALPWLLDDFLVSLALSCLMYVALASSWAMFSGATRYVSLGTSAFFGLGAYVSAWTVATAPWPVVVAGGALVAAAFAGLAGLAILHLRGTYFAVLTFGLSELTRHAVTYGEKQYAGTVGRVLTAHPSSAEEARLLREGVTRSSSLAYALFGAFMTGVGSVPTGIMLDAEEAKWAAGVTGILSLGAVVTLAVLAGRSDRRNDTHREAAIDRYNEWGREHGCPAP